MEEGTEVEDKDVAAARLCPDSQQGAPLPVDIPNFGSENLDSQKWRNLQIYNLPRVYFEVHLAMGQLHSHLQVCRTRLGASSLIDQRNSSLGLRGLTGLQS